MVAESFFHIYLSLSRISHHVFDHNSPGITTLLNLKTHRYARWLTWRGQNLSFVLEGIHQVKFEDRPIPELKDPHDVLINVKYTGICGSDVRDTIRCGAGVVER